MAGQQTLPNRHRPKVFAEVVGQESEVEVVKKIARTAWKPNAVMITGPFGTGKTTIARLMARALLCDSPMFDAEQEKKAAEDRGEPYEPCGVCQSCKAMDSDNHQSYTEVDAASHGAVSDIRAMKDEISFRMGDKIRIQYYDESHMLSKQAQNALLQVLEEGAQDVIFVFATTDQGAMLSTIRSRCVELRMKLLSASQITERMKVVASREGIQYEEKAFRIVASYVRGHARDALVMLEQLAKMATGSITEEQVRTYLRLDKFDDVYKLLCEADKKTGVELLEHLLCNYSASELTEVIGEVLVNAYKLSVGIDTFTQVDRAWLGKVLEARGKDFLLPAAEATLKLQTDFATINYGIATLANILFEGGEERARPSRSIVPGGAPAPVAAAPHRKPGR